MVRRNESCDDGERNRSHVEVFLMGHRGVIPLNSGENRSISNLLEELFQSLTGRFRGYDLGSAHFEYRADKLVPAEVDQRFKAACLNEDSTKLNGIQISDFFYRILRGETSLDLSRFNLVTNIESTRGSLEHVINKVLVANKGKPLALPIPNWHFWEMDGINYSDPFRFYKALSADELVSGFRKVAKSKKTSGIVLVDPSNPLMYRITEEVAIDLDKIAQKYNQEVIIDDVLRGTMPIGQRDSIARWFSKPYVVEGMSKRFGDQPAGQISYIACPKEGKVQVTREDLPDIRHFGDLLFGELLTMMYDYGNDVIARELAERNSAFDQGLNSHNLKFKIKRPCPTSLISLVEVPSECGFNAGTLAYSANHNGVCIGPLTSAFWPDGFVPCNTFDKTFRITVGKHDASQLREAGRYLSIGTEFMMGRV